jgi:hypothetical protein
LQLAQFLLAHQAQLIQSLSLEAVARVIWVAAVAAEEAFTQQANPCRLPVIRLQLGLEEQVTKIMVALVQTGQTLFSPLLPLTLEQVVEQVPHTTEELRQ